MTSVANLDNSFVAVQGSNILQTWYKILEKAFADEWEQHICIIYKVCFPLCNSSFSLSTHKCALVDSDEGYERVSDRLRMSVYIHLFAQRYPACVRPTGVVRLSIVEVNKNPSLTKRGQTASVCSGFPYKHSTRRATDSGEGKGHWGEERRAVRTRLVLCNSRWLHLL